VDKADNGIVHQPDIAAVGDSAFLMRFARRKSIWLNAAIHGLADRIRSGEFEDIEDVIPGYSSLLVRLRPGAAGLLSLAGQIEKEIVDGAAAQRTHLPKVLWEIPVAYGDEYGPDLPAVARHARLGEKEVVARHSSAPYYVYCLGFAPGFPYLGGLSCRLHCPRRDEPRQSIPGGSVGIGGQQTGVYPQPGPGGWQLIGRTPCQLFAARRQPPSVIAPGNLLRFRPVGEDEYRRILREVEECGTDSGFRRIELDRQRSRRLVRQIDKVEAEEEDSP